VRATFIVLFREGLPPLASTKIRLATVVASASRLKRVRT